MNSNDSDMTPLQEEDVHPFTPFTHIASTSLVGQPVSLIVDPQVNLPLVNTQVGNLFKDRFVASLFWYLPAFDLADEPDLAFSFAATQSGVDKELGIPFNQASLTLSVKKIVPADVQLAQTQNTTAEFREIPLDQLSVMLSTTAKDENGADQKSLYPGTVAAQANGSLLLTFDNILGVAVIAAYENLAQMGGAQVTLSASYAVWRLLPQIVIPVDNRPIWPRLQQNQFHIASTQPQTESVTEQPVFNATVVPLNMALTSFHSEEAATHPSFAETTTAMQPHSEEARLHLQPSLIETVTATEAVPPSHMQEVISRASVIEPFHPIVSEDRYVQDTVHVDFSVVLGQKYRGEAYKLKFSVADGSVVHPILSADDLRNYNVRQSEFSEFLAFGDISSKYPSFSRLYIGVLSRTIVAIPRKYGIIRGSAGCAAVCQALVDSSPTTISGCRFQFAFSLAPVISPIDLLQLSQDIGAFPGTKDCILQLPSQFDSKGTSMLVTPFKSSCTYANGPLPHTFYLAVEIEDDQSGSPAVANANLFIKQLCSTVEPYLFGSFGIKLDDYYAQPIDSNVVLNFRATGGTDELGFTIDEAQQSIVLVNRSSLDLLLTRDALCTPNQVTITPLQQSLTSQQTTMLPLPVDHTNLNVLVERTLAVETPLTKQSLGRYLAFQTQVVQNIQYDLGINASGVSFNARGISRITVQISFADLPNVAVPLLTLSADHMVNSTRIVIPVEYAISTLSATLAFTVLLADPQQSSISFTRTNDFIDFAIFVLRDIDIPEATPV